MQGYLYLASPEFAETWVNGGKIPIFLASRYLSTERKGTLTPDENLVYDSTVPFESLGPDISLTGFGLKNISVRNYISNGKRIPDLNNVSRYFEDGFILSFASGLSRQAMAHFEAKVCAVVIHDMDALRTHIDQYFPEPGIGKACDYTFDHQRNHFLKSSEDAWQDEYRLFWPRRNSEVEAMWVDLPPGLASHVSALDWPMRVMERR